MNDDLHLICKAEGRNAPSGLQALQIRIARALNKLWSRRGSVFADRDYDHILKSRAPGSGPAASESLGPQCPCALRLPRPKFVHGVFTAPDGHQQNPDDGEIPTPIRGD